MQSWFERLFCAQSSQLSSVAFVVARLCVCTLVSFCAGFPQSQFMHVVFTSSCPKKDMGEGTSNTLRGRHLYPLLSGLLLVPPSQLLNHTITAISQMPTSSSLALATSAALSGCVPAQHLALQSSGNQLLPSPPSSVASASILETRLSLSLI